MQSRFEPALKPKESPELKKSFRVGETAQFTQLHSMEVWGLDREMASSLLSTSIPVSRWLCGAQEMWLTCIS